MLEILGLAFFGLFLYWIWLGVPWAMADYLLGNGNEDARLKSTEQWEEENMTNKERVAKWREEQKKSD